MLGKLRSALARPGRWAWRHKLVALAVVVVLAAAGTGIYLAATDDEGDGGPPSPGVAPSVVREEAVSDDSEELETEDLGFPAFATKNTTRVAGPDPLADAAGVALAVEPSAGGVPGPDAVSLVDARDWRAGIAAAALVAEPVGAPILVSEDGEIPPLTEGALRALDPGGSSDTGAEEAFLFGDAAEPDDLETKRVEGANAAELAAEAAGLREELAGPPEHLLIASSDAPEFAMPAAAWAARSGDPVLFAQRNSLPAATREALERHEGVPTYVLGPEEAISDRALAEIRKLAGSALRIGDEGPTENAIAFARYADESFGWNINDPGHGFVVANASRPLDAAAAAALSASGTWGPLLVVEDGASVPAALRGYLLDLKPGYDQDPTRAVYNHVWLIGDSGAISVGFQAQVDELAEVAPISPGAGGELAPPPGAGEPEDAPDAGGRGGAGGRDRGGSRPRA